MAIKTMGVLLFTVIEIKKFARWNNRYELICGDSREVDLSSWLPEIDCVVFDPDWQNSWHSILPDHHSLLAFSDPRYAPKTLKQFGDEPSWIFAWDCQSLWWTGKHNPLARMKLCFWYGNKQLYDARRTHYGPPVPAMKSRNKRGEYKTEPYEAGYFLQDIWKEQITKLHKTSGHNHSKPPDWVRCLIGNTSSGAIYDPFAGSGTSFTAALELGRDCYGVEINPEYCQMIEAKLLEAGCERLE